MGSYGLSWNNYTIYNSKLLSVNPIKATILFLFSFTGFDIENIFYALSIATALYLTSVSNTLLVFISLDIKNGFAITVNDTASS